MKKTVTVAVSLPALLWVLLCHPAFAQPAPERKKALLLANSKYQSIPLALNDRGVLDLKRILEGLDFQVTLAENVRTVADFERILESFKLSLRPGEDCLIYYAGYAIQDEGHNYLIPTDYPRDYKGAIFRAAIGLERVTEMLEEARPRLSVLFLDGSWGAEVFAGHTGLAAPTTPATGKWFFFLSAAPNQVSTLSPGGTGLFTSALVNALQRPGLDLTELAAQVKRDVQSASNQSQTPADWGADLPKFYFRQPLLNGQVRRNKDFLEYAYIPAGKFKMGCVPASEDQCNADEKPLHEVEIGAPFWLGRTEVPEKAYVRSMEMRKRKYKPPKHNTNAGQDASFPVVSIKWEDAQRYCREAGGGLPTEAQWEYAARGGEVNSVYPYSDIKTSRDKANFRETGGADTYLELAPIASFDPNGFGLYDMAGNVWEWVADLYDAGYYTAAASRDPLGPDKGTTHVARGGSYESDPKKHLRISYRRGDFKGSSNIVGFRCALPDTAEVKAQFRN